MALIKKIEYKGNEFNDLHKYEIELEDNGEKVIGNIFKKTDNPYFKEGDEVEYTINNKGTLKLNKPGQTPYNQNQPKISGGGYKYQTNDQESERIARSVALKEALLLRQSELKDPKPLTFYLAIATSFSKYILDGTIQEPNFDEALKSQANQNDSVPF